MYCYCIKGPLRTAFATFAKLGCPQRERIPALKTRNQMTIQPGLYHLLFISAALFFIGVYGFFTRRNLITMLMSVELVLNSVNLNFIAFNKYIWPNQLDGV